MKKIPFNFDWTRVDGEYRTIAMSWAFKNGKKVDLPDDFILNMKRIPTTDMSDFENGYFPGAAAYYVKEFTIPEEYKGKHAILNIDGAYMETEVYLNRDKIGAHPYGYSPYQTEMTKSLNMDGNNKLTIATTSRQPASRWYCGGGIFREVSILVGGDVYLNPWDLYITTPETQPDAKVRASLGITNTLAEDAKVTISIKITNDQGICVAEEQLEEVIPAGIKKECIKELTLSSPRLWDLEDPYLYQMEVSITKDNEVIDETVQKFGVRKIEINGRQGFRLNGRKMKIYGGALHHDHGPLGSASFKDAEIRRLKILKEAGFNGIRTAHNPVSEAFLDQCDALGMLVLEEFFDTWVNGKKPMDYHRYFEDWWMRDIDMTVRRDRNHPCIFAWSIGNEIPDMNGSSNGYETTKKLADFTRKTDPSRPVSAAINGMREHPYSKDTGDQARDLFEPVKFDPTEDTEIVPYEGFENEVDPFMEHYGPAIESLDFLSYNYMYFRYGHDKVHYPDMAIIGTEAHGVYSYDAWHEIWNNDNVIGECVWTVWDNMGEVGTGRPMYDIDKALKNPMDEFGGKYPWITCYQGDFDMIGDPKPRNLYRRILWGVDKGMHLLAQDPALGTDPGFGFCFEWEDVVKSWAFDEQYYGKPIRVVAYADADEVEFILNGESVARVPAKKLYADAVIEYHPGTLEAIAYKEGKEVAREKLVSAGKAARINLTLDKEEISANGMDLCHVSIQIVDENNNPVYKPEYNLTVNVSGAGTLKGLGSGMPETEEQYGTGQRFTWRSKALAIIRAGKTAGDIEIAVCAQGLPVAVAHIQAK